MNGVRHPFSRALYEADGPGRVRVTTPDGRTGWFAGDGRWLDGERLDADPHLCSWVDGPRAVHRMAK